MDSSSALRLPGLGHSLWISEASPKLEPLNLPGNGFSLWPGESSQVKMNPPTVSLPGDGLSAWIDSSFPQSHPKTIEASASPAIRLPGLGHSLWDAPSLKVVPLKLASQGADDGPEIGSKLHLGGAGFSLWTPGTFDGPVRLPGNSHSLWTKAHTPSLPSDEAKRSQTSRPTFQTYPTQPSPLAQIMKSIGLARIIGLVLLLALLLGFLGTRKEADELRSKLADTDTKLGETQKERQDYLDRANLLKVQVDETTEKADQLTQQLEALEKAKTGIENTLNTQIANLEKATSAAEAAKAGVEAKLQETLTASAAKEMELNTVLEAAKKKLAESQDEVAQLSSSVEELTQAKSEVEKQLKANLEALQAAKDEAAALKGKLDQSLKATSDLEKEVEDLKKSLEEKETDANSEEAASTPETDQPSVAKGDQPPTAS